jgi:hypothetical protein
MLNIMKVYSALVKSIRKELISEKSGKRLTKIEFIRKKPVYREAPEIASSCGVISRSHYFCLPFFFKKDESTKSDSEPV